MKKQHHTVSEFYLRGFAGPPAKKGNPRGFWVYRRGEGEPKWLPPESVAIRKHFYSYRDEAGQRHADIEDVLGKLESVAAPIIRKVVKDGRLTEQEKLRFAYFVATTWARTAKHRSLLVRIVEHMGNAQLRSVFSNKENLRARLEQYRQATGQALDADETYEAIMGGGLRQVLTERAKVGLSLSTVRDVGPAIMGMRWLLLDAPPGSQFVTSDTPVVLATSPSSLWPEVGWATPGLEATFPLDATHCLLLTHDGDHGRARCLQRFVDEVTRRMALVADTEVYAPTRNAIVARQLK